MQTRGCWDANVKAANSALDPDKQGPETGKLNLGVMFLGFKSHEIQYC